MLKLAIPWRSHSCFNTATIWQYPWHACALIRIIFLHICKVHWTPALIASKLQHRERLTEQTVEGRGSRLKQYASYKATIMISIINAVILHAKPVLHRACDWALCLCSTECYESLTMPCTHQRLKSSVYLHSFSVWVLDIIDTLSSCIPSLLWVKACPLYDCITIVYTDSILAFLCSVFLHLVIKISMEIGYFNILETMQTHGWYSADLNSFVTIFLTIIEGSVQSLDWKSGVEW